MSKHQMSGCIVFWLLSSVSFLLSGCIGDDISNCHYDDKRNDVVLELMFSPVIEAEGGFKEDGVENYSMAIYKDDGSLENVYGSSHFVEKEDKIEFSTKLNPGKYHFVFLADNGKEFYSVNSSGQHDDFQFYFNHTDENVVPYGEMALYHGYLKDYEVKEDGKNTILIDLDKITNTVNVEVRGLEDKGIKPEEVVVDISTSNMVYPVHGVPQVKEEMLHYEPNYTITEHATTRAKVYLQDLFEELPSMLKITRRNPETRTDNVLYERNLVDLLKQYIETYDGKVKDITKVHEYNIDLDLEGQFFKIYVNGWLIVESEQDIN